MDDLDTKQSAYEKCAHYVYLQPVEVEYLPVQSITNINLTDEDTIEEKDKEKDSDYDDLENEDELGDLEGMLLYTISK